MGAPLEDVGWCNTMAKRVKHVVPSNVVLKCSTRFGEP